MTQIQLNARDMVVEISDGAATPVWTEIAGLVSFKFDPSKEEKTADTTTFMSGGHYEQEVMQRGAVISLDGMRIADDLTGAPDPGQLLVELLHEKFGAESVGRIRFRHLLDTSWKLWKATTTLGAQDGKTNDKLGWSTEFSRNGTSTTVAVAP